MAIKSIYLTYEASRKGDGGVLLTGWEIHEVDSLTPRTLNELVRTLRREYFTERGQDKGMSIEDIYIEITSICPLDTEEESPVLQTVGFTDEEIQVIDDLASQNELTHIEVLRNALRLYQAHRSELVTVTFSAEEPTGCPEIDD